jgi:hypothetical protein
MVLEAFVVILIFDGSAQSFFKSLCDGRMPRHRILKPISKIVRLEIEGSLAKVWRFNIPSLGRMTVPQSYGGA